MKKLFYYSPYFFPDNNAGVIRNNVFIQTLNEEFQINLLTGTKNAECNSLIFTNPKNTDRFLVRLFKEVLSGLELFFRVLINRNDFYFFSSPNYFTIFIGVLACVLKRDKFILDIRDIYPEVFFDAGLVSKNNILSRILISYTRIIYNHASLITTVTNGLVNKLESQTQTKVILVRNGFDDDLFKEEEAHKNNQYSCIFHGTFGAFQDIELLAEIIEKMEQFDPSIHFHIIGKGPKEETIKNIKSSNSTYHGILPYKDLPSMITKCHLGLSFRIDNEITKDSFPVKVYEYIGSCLPIFSSPKNCEAGEFIKEYKLGFNFNSSNDICEKIVELKNNHKLQKELESNVRNARPQFTRQTQAKILVEEILKL